VHTPAQPPADPIEEIKKYKSLMEEGIISKEEFEAKKKQLLGIYILLDVLVAGDTHITLPERRLSQIY
jgi:hypothetical protein